jgi:hypothetical protein
MSQDLVTVRNLKTNTEKTVTAVVAEILLASPKEFVRINPTVSLQEFQAQIREEKSASLSDLSEPTDEKNSAKAKPKA